jgi:hypothetical protein
MKTLLAASLGVSDTEWRAWLLVFDRLDPPEQKILAKCVRRIRKGMPIEEAARRAFVERGWSEAASMRAGCKPDLR